MIRFPCTCGHRFEVDDDLAGSSLQCPACGLLTDVPTVSELASFTDEGTYRLDADRPVTENPKRIAELEILYSKSKQDAAGNEIDLRFVGAGQPIARGRDAPPRAAEEFEDDGGELELKPAAREPEVIARPKYDPETGELIRPLDLREEPDRVADPASIPVAKATISYATKEAAKPVSPLSIAAQLLMPLNLVVMFFIFCAHVFSGMMFVVMASALFFLVPPFLIVQALMLAHYGNVIDDTGRNAHDDLPRPLRDLSWYDDIWSPFVAMFGGLMIAFVVPTFLFGLLFRYTPVPDAVAPLIGWVIGTVFGPAILLTTNTSGSTFNLRPDRLLHVIRISGGHYVGLVLLWALAWPVYLVGWVGFCVAMYQSFGMMTGPKLIVFHWAVVFPALALGIYLMHYFCWYVGLMYRAHHAAFPWVLQRYVPDPARRRGGPGGRRPTAGHLVIPPAVHQEPRSSPRSLP